MSQEVENRPRQGSFYLTILIGGETKTTEVPTIQVTYQKGKSSEERTKFQEFCDNYINGQFASGIAVAAFRTNQNGMCIYKINPNCVNAEITKFQYEQIYGFSTLVSKKINSDRLYEYGLIDCIDSISRMNKPNMSISGTYNGQAFNAQIFFVPTPQ